MLKQDLLELYRLFNDGDIEMLRKLNECCNKEDKAEVELLLYLNDTVGIGWGEPSAPMFEEEFQSRQTEYYERRDALLDKYAPREFWETGKMPNKGVSASQEEASADSMVQSDKKTKRLHLTIQCLAVYESGIDVPADMSIEEAIAYAKQHLKEVPLGAMEYVQDSDVLDEENCDFDDYEYGTSVQERLAEAKGRADMGETVASERDLEV